MAALFVALIHYPVIDRNGRIVTSAITSLDLHDIARSARTYGVSAFFVVHPVADQREFAIRVIDHWQTGYGRQFDSRRREALELVRIVTDLDEAIVEAERIGGGRPTIVYTSARTSERTQLLPRCARGWIVRMRPPVMLLLRHRVRDGAGDAASAPTSRWRRCSVPARTIICRCARPRG